MNKLKLPVTNPMMGIGTIIEDNGKSVVVRFEGNYKNTLVEKDLLYVGSDEEFEYLNAWELDTEYIQDELENDVDEEDIDVDSNHFHQRAAELKNELQERYGIQDSIEDQISDRVDYYMQEYGTPKGSKFMVIDGGYKIRYDIGDKEYFVFVEATSQGYYIVDVIKDLRRINNEKVDIFSKAFEVVRMKFDEGTYKDILKAM